MPMSALASTMSILDKSALKKGHSPFMRVSRAMRSSGASLTNASTAESNPSQPGKVMRAWPQEKLQGMARRSSIRRDAGREPIQFGDFRDRRCREEKVDKSRRLVNERSIGRHAQARERRGGVEKILGSGTGMRKKRCFERRGHERLKIVQADVGVRIFRRDHLALLGDAYASADGSGRLRADRVESRSTAPSDGAAPAME